MLRCNRNHDNWQFVTLCYDNKFVDRLESTCRRNSIHVHNLLKLIKLQLNYITGKSVFPVHVVPKAFEQTWCMNLLFAFALIFAKCKSLS